MTEQEIVTGSSGEVQFIADRKYAALLWLPWLMPVAPLVAMLNTGFTPPLAIALIVVSLLSYMAHRVFRRVYGKRGEILVRLFPHGIESSRFDTAEKQYLWSDVAEARLEGASNGRFLRLNLQPHPARTDRRSFWNGANPSRPSLPVTGLSARDQERLAAAVAERLQGRGAAAHAFSQELAQERAMNEQLDQLAPRTWVTWTLIAINVAVWLANLNAGAQVSGSSPEFLFQWGANSTSAVQGGEWWRLLTAMFLHGNMTHILMNMIGLASIGATLERVYGPRLFLLIYLGSGLVGSAASMHFSALRAVSVGASGAVFGIAGALLVAAIHHRKKMPLTFGRNNIGGMLFFIGYSLLQGFASPRIDNAAHVGGLLAGLALAMILPERFDLAHFQRAVKTRAAIALVFVAAAVALVAAGAPTALFDQRIAFEATGKFVQAMKALQEAGARLQREQDELKAGKLSEREVDDRSRAVHAPVWRGIERQLREARFSPGDPRAPLAADYTRFAELMAEGLEMNSVEVDGRLQPADLARAKAMQGELARLQPRIMQRLEQLKAQAEAGTTKKR